MTRGDDDGKRGERNATESLLFCVYLSEAFWSISLGLPLRSFVFQICFKSVSNLIGVAVK